MNITQTSKKLIWFTICWRSRIQLHISQNISPVIDKILLRNFVFNWLSIFIQHISVRSNQTNPCTHPRSSRTWNFCRTSWNSLLWKRTRRNYPQTYNIQGWTTASVPSLLGLGSNPNQTITMGKLSPSHSVLFISSSKCFALLILWEW